MLNFKSNDGTVLYGRKFSPDSLPRASVVIVHGIGEQSSRYLHVGEVLASAGFHVGVFDLRGHGRSEGERGILRHYDDFLDDVAAAVTEFHLPGGPLFLYAHSLGGQIAINYMLRDRPTLAGAVIASPWLRLAFQVNPLKLLLATLTRFVAPSFTQDNDQDITRLSRDLDFLNSMPDQELNHSRVSARMYFEMVKGARMAFAGAEDLATPLLLLHGTHDRVTSFSASEEFFGRVASPDKTFKPYPEGYHEMHNDVCRESVLADVADWIGARCETADANP